MPVKRAVIAADDLPPEREGHGGLTLSGDGSSFAGSVDGSGGASTAVAEDGSSFGVLEAERITVFGEAPSTTGEKREEKGREEKGMSQYGEGNGKTVADASIVTWEKGRRGRTGRTQA